MSIDCVVKTYLFEAHRCQELSVNMEVKTTGLISVIVPDRRQLNRFGYLLAGRMLEQELNSTRILSAVRFKLVPFKKP